MNPIDFPEANRTFTRPAGMTDEECAPLRVQDTGEALVSCWRPTDEERDAIAAGAPLRLWIFGRGHPPVALDVALPLIAPGPDAPAAREAGRTKGLDLDRLQGLAQGIGDAVERAIADSGGAGTVGFGLFVFSFGEGGWMTWVSNAERQSMVPALKEWIEHNEAPPPKARG